MVMAVSIYLSYGGIKRGIAWHMAEGDRRSLLAVASPSPLLLTLHYRLSSTTVTDKRRGRGDGISAVAGVSLNRVAACVCRIAPATFVQTTRSEGRRCAAKRDRTA